ncbi:MAG: hypothetical protein HKN39_05480 [Flavobacteriales bacterium]|nr:hypothetical protein [Flavobacteriales bacterium]
MFKILSLAFGLNLLGFIAIFQDNEVSVEQIAPLTLAPGESYEVKVNFSKKEIQGFAKFEVEVDDDLEVMVGNIGSASFSFENGIAKFIWFVLPEESDFTISYILKNSDETIGNEKHVYAQFSYLKNNEKKVFNLTPHQLLIEKFSNDSLVANDNVINTESKPIVPARSDEEKLKAIKEHTVVLEREFERLDAGSYRMNITINKGPIEGFGKLEEIVPDGFEYKEESTTGAIFTKVKGKAKFVWFDLPGSELIDISYILEADESNVVGLHNITGEFTYIIDDQDVVSRTVPAYFKISASDMVDIIEDNGLSKDDEVVEEIANSLWKQNNVNEPERENTKVSGIESLEDVASSSEEKSTEEDVVVQTWHNDVVRSKAESTTETDMLDVNSTLSIEEEDSLEAIEKNITAQGNDRTEVQDDELIENITGISSSSEGVSYRVQICATKKVAEKDYFKKHKNFKYEVNIENHDGWIKYTTGEYPLYKQARNSRGMIVKNYDLDGPFVTAYNYGDRITVQEALMISGQKWFK